MSGPRSLRGGGDEAPSDEGISPEDLMCFLIGNFFIMVMNW
jgi:hypothetical protein